MIARVQACLRFSTGILLWRGMLEGRSLYPYRRTGDVGYDCVVLHAIHEAANQQTPAAAAPMSEFRRVEAAMICWLNARKEAGARKVSLSELIAGLASETTDHDLIARVHAYLRARNLLLRGMLEGRSLNPYRRIGDVGYDCVVPPAIHAAANQQTPARLSPVVTINPPQVVIDGNAYALSLDAAEYLHVLSK